MSNDSPSATPDDQAVDSLTVQLGDLTVSLSRVRRAQAKATPVPLFGRRVSGNDAVPVRSQDDGFPEAGATGTEEDGDDGPPPAPLDGAASVPHQAGDPFEARLLYARGSGRNARRRIQGLRWLPVDGERSPLAPRYYVLLRDCGGAEHSPALLFTSWQQISPYVCVDVGARRTRASSQLAELAVFAGWPSQAEAEEFAAGAGTTLR